MCFFEVSHSSILFKIWYTFSNTLIYNTKVNYFDFSLLLLEGACYGKKTDEADFFEEQLVFLSVLHLVERFSNFLLNFRNSNLKGKYVILLNMNKKIKNLNIF